MADAPSFRAPRLVIAVLMALFGVTLLVIGILRPAVAWNTRKIQSLIEMIGVTGAAIFYIAFGALFVVLAVILILKRRRQP